MNKSASRPYVVLFCFILSDFEHPHRIGKKLIFQTSNQLFKMCNFIFTRVGLGNSHEIPHRIREKVVWANDQLLKMCKIIFTYDRPENAYENALGLGKYEILHINCQLFIMRKLISQVVDLKFHMRTRSGMGKWACSG